MNRRNFPFAALAILVLAAGPAAAWHDRGHMAVALIAYRQLDGGRQGKIRDVLKNHPHFEEFLSADRPADAPLDEWIFMRAAVWPDWVRENHLDEVFNLPFHHYVNLPLKRLNGASDQQIQEIEENIAALPGKESSGQLLQELPKRLDEVRDNSSEASKRAIALCWVLHLVGDIHQPLHAAAMFTKYSRQGDHGGNAAYVPWHGRPENLHFIWDGVVGWDEFTGPTLTPYGVVELIVRDYQQRHPVTDQERGVSEVKAWALESRDLADKEVYSFEGQPIRVIFVRDQHPHLNPAHMSPLLDGYADRARGVAEKRVELAGNRLAEQLKQLF